MIGDQADMRSRIDRLLPPWFGGLSESPVISSALDGAAWVLSFAYSLYAFAKLQTRLATMTGGWLELAASDFFDNFRRFSQETDAAYSRRIRLEVFRPKNTRRAIDRVVHDISGIHPDIFESWRPGDCGGWGTTSMGYGLAGAYGCSVQTFDVLISMPLPQNLGIPDRGGWGDGTGGYGIGNFSFVDDADFTGSGATLTQLITMTDRVRTAGITYLMQFTSPLLDLTTEAGDVLTTQGSQTFTTEG